MKYRVVKMALVFESDSPEDRVLSEGFREAFVAATVNFCPLWAYAEEECDGIDAAREFITGKVYNHDNNPRDAAGEGSAGNDRGDNPKPAGHGDRGEGGNNSE